MLKSVLSICYLPLGGFVYVFKTCFSITTLSFEHRVKAVLSGEDSTTGFRIWCWSLSILSGGKELLEN